MSLIILPKRRRISAAIEQLFKYDKHFGSVGALLHGGSPAAIAQLADETGATVVNTNVVSLDNSEVAAPYFNGATDITIPSSNDFNLGTGDFTIELEFLPMNPASGAYQRIFSRQVIGSTSYTISIQLNPVGVLQVLLRDSINGVSVLNNTVMKPAPGGWHAVAVSRKGIDTFVHFNGEEILTVNVASHNLSFSEPITLGKLAGNTEYFRGQIRNLRITKGVSRYTTDNYVWQEPAFDDTDPHWANVVLALPLTDGDLTDHKGHTVIPAPNLVLAPKAKVAAPQMYLNGTNAVAQIPSSSRTTLGSRDFTAEAWVYVTQAITTDQALFESTVSGGLGLVLTSTGVKVTRAQVKNDFVQAIPVPVAQWVHVALCRKGTTYTIFVGGTPYVLGDQTYTYPASAINIGSNYNSSAQWFNGHVQDFRVTPGVARYEAQFVPSTKVMPDMNSHLYSADSVVAQLRFNGANLSTAFVEDIQGLPVSKIGNPVISTDRAKYGTSSLKLDGSSALQIGPYGDQLALAGDLMAEAWVCPTIELQSPFYMGLFTNGPTSGSTPAGFDVGIGPGNMPFIEIAGTQVNGTIAVPKDKWTHIALVRTGATATNLRLYVNGVQNISMNGGSAALGTNQMLRIGVRRTGASYWQGYIDQIRMTRGRTMYQAPFLPPSRDFEVDTISGDPYLAYTPLALKFEGANGSKAVVNSINGETVNWTAAGSISTANKKWGTSAATWTSNASASFPSSSKYDVGTRDFTLECHLYLAAGFDWYPQFISRSSTGAAGFQWSLGFGSTRASRRMAFSIYDGAGTAVAQILTTDAMPQNVWTHIAVVRQAGVIYIYWDGVLKASGAAAQSLETNTTGQPFFVGSANSAWMPNSFLDEVRFTVGVARYPAAFTPPAAEYPVTQSRASGDLFHEAVVAHYPFDTDLVDVRNAIAWTGGAAAISTNASRIGSGALYCDGTASSYRAAAPASFNLSGLPFTAECWVNLKTIGAVQHVMGINKEGVNSDWLVKISATGTVVATIAKTNTITGTLVLPTNSWAHIALVGGYDGKTYLYVNGVLQGSVTATPSANLYGYNFTVGADNDGAYRMSGYINELRITKAVRYFGNFIPPAYRLPVVAAVELE